MATKVFRVSFDLEVQDDVNELLVEEAVTAVWDEEVIGQDGETTRCGVRFLDSTNFLATLVERRS